jgi:ribonuclease T1
VEVVVRPWLRLAILLAVVVLAWRYWPAPTDTDASRPVASQQSGGAPVTARAGRAPYPDFLPLEAITTLEAIERGGPFPYDRDGSVFQNRERRLPERPRGYYREYTVATPGSRDRGARRIVTGGDPPEVVYYTDDHYRSFRRIEAGS